MNREISFRENKTRTVVFFVVVLFTFAYTVRYSLIFSYCIRTSTLASFVSPTGCHLTNSYFLGLGTKSIEGWVIYNI